MVMSVVPCDRPFVGRDDVECWKITNTDDISREVMSDVFPIGEDNVIGVAKNAGGDWEVAIRVEPPTPQPDPPTPTPEPEPPTPQPELPTPQPEPPTPQPELPTPEPEPPTPEPEPPTPEPEPPVVDPPVSTSDPDPPISTPISPPPRTPPVVTPPDPPEPIVEPEPVPVKPIVLPLTMRYEHTFPAGVSLQHIPLDIEGLNSVPGVFNLLVDDVIQLVASRGISGWTHIRYSNHPAINAIWKSIGFVAVMDNEVTIPMEGTFGGWQGTTKSVYAHLYLRDGGLTLLGVPVRSKYLETVGDFWKFFDNVISVKGINPSVSIEDRVSDDWFVELDPDTLIDCCTSYLIESDGGDQRALWGVPWAYEASAAAPGVVAGPHLMATTWAAIKVRQ